MSSKLIINIIILVCALTATTSCQVSFYAITSNFNHEYEYRNYKQAIDELEDTRLLKKKKRNQVLYYLNYGTLAQLTGDYETSIKYFNLADQYISTHSSMSAGDAALAIVTNPMKTDYRTESFEQIMLHYYQAMNYISIKDYEEAMVECRKMNEELQKLDDYRKDNGKHYTQNAFGHYIMGILYETTGDYNNAYIAYKNSLDIYDNDYTKLYDTPTPESLKTAAIRAAYKVGFKQEARELEKKYNTKYTLEKGKGRAVIFIEDGDSPIKVERVFNFTKSGSVGLMSYSSDDGDLNIPILTPTSQSDQNSLEQVKTITLALPKYQERTINKRPLPSMYTIDGKTQMAALAENLNKIAPQSLKDRYWKELGLAIVRVGVKQAVSSAVSKQNEWAGLAIAVTQAVTEKADTRNWQTLPAQIRIIDIEMEPGEHTMDLPNGSVLQFSVDDGKTTFVNIKN